MWGQGDLVEVQVPSRKIHNFDDVWIFFDKLGAKVSVTGRCPCPIVCQILGDPSSLPALGFRGLDTATRIFSTYSSESAMPRSTKLQQAPFHVHSYGSLVVPSRRRNHAQMQQLCHLQHLLHLGFTECCPTPEHADK